MLTVKWISDEGHEVVNETGSVYFERQNGGATMWARIDVEHTPRGIPSHSSVTYDSGTFYVMNRHGATVARHELGERRPPSPAS